MHFTRYAEGLLGLSRVPDDTFNANWFLTADYPKTDEKARHFRTFIALCGCGLRSFHRLSWYKRSINMNSLTGGNLLACFDAWRHSLYLQYIVFVNAQAYCWPLSHLIHYKFYLPRIKAFFVVLPWSKSVYLVPYNCIDETYMSILTWKLNCDSHFYINRLPALNSSRLIFLSSWHCYYCRFVDRTR